MNQFPLPSTEDELVPHIAGLTRRLEQSKAQTSAIERDLTECNRKLEHIRSSTVVGGSTSKGPLEEFLRANLVNPSEESISYLLDFFKQIGAGLNELYDLTGDADWQELTKLNTMLALKTHFRSLRAALLQSADAPPTPRLE